MDGKVLGIERRRRWSKDEKSRIVEETLMPGAVVSEVARRHGVAQSLLFTWRRLARTAEPARRDGSILLPVEIGAMAAPSGLEAGRPSRPATAWPTSNNRDQSSIARTRRPALELDYAGLSRRRCGCAVVRGRRHRPALEAYGLRPGGSHRARRGDHHPGRRQSLRRDGPRVLVSGNDFYSTPRLSPDGSRLSWLTWHHPDMPWVANEAWVGDILLDGTIGNVFHVAGGRNSRGDSSNIPGV